MAASISAVIKTGFVNCINIRAFSGQRNRCLSSLVNLSTSEPNVVEYPPVKGRYPPGQWGDLPNKVAWVLYDRGNHLNEIKDLKFRLEAYAGAKEHYFYHMRCHDKRPATLYKQYVTKTHVVHDQPDKFKDVFIQDEDFNNIKEIVERDITQQNNQIFSCSYPVLERSQNEKVDIQLLKKILHTIMNSLSFKHPYLLTTQVDNDTRMETFWYRTGNEETSERKGSYYSLIAVQYEDNARFHVRTEKPTPLFVDEDDELCKKPSVEFPYSPMVYGQFLKWKRPITTCGHWIGDPCEFSHLSLYTMTGGFNRCAYNFGEDIAHEVLSSMILSSGFGACVAQAHNQGFHAFRDVTYPFNTQTLAYGGGFLYFGSYQLNTMQLWVNDEANPKGNVVWIEGPQKLFNRAEDGTIKDYSEEALKRLVQCFCLEPEERGVDMRPYAADGGPLETKLHLNYKGDPLIPRKKIGRFEYPANAVYF